MSMLAGSYTTGRRNHVVRKSGHALLLEIFGFRLQRPYSVAGEFPTFRTYYAESARMVEGIDKLIR